MLVKVSKPIGNGDESRNVAADVCVLIPGHHHARDRHCPTYTQIVGRVRGGRDQGQ